MKFLLLPKCGNHRIGGVEYHSDDVIETDDNLEEKFPLKFKKVADDTVATTPPALAEAPQAQQASAPAGTTEAPESPGANPDAVPPGEEVTAKFDGAEKAGLKVFKVGQRFVVTAEDNVGVSLNGSGGTRAEVNQFITDFG